MQFSFFSLILFGCILPAVPLFAQGDGGTDFFEVPDGLAGYWTFEDSEHPGKAAYGQDLLFEGAAPEHLAFHRDFRLQSRTLTQVVRTVAGPGNHLRVPHNIGPNGGGQKTNVFSLVLDILAPSPRTLWHALYQTSLPNTDDAEFFMGPPEGRLGITGLVYSDESLPRDEWHRVVLSVDLREGGFFNTYVNGELFFEHSPPAPDSRWALEPDAVLLFADDNQENQSLLVASVAVFSKALSPEDIAAIGDPGIRLLRTAGTPPAPQWLNPPSQVTVGEWTPFELRALDAENHPVQFQVDWGDGRVGEWTDFVPSDESITLPRVWIEPGTYTPWLRARNQTGALSAGIPAPALTASVAATPENVHGLKVMTYNTFAHFGQRKRVHETAGWLRAQRPDLLALQELSNITRDELADLARSWGHSHAAVMSETGSTLALTSRFPIENVVRHTGGYHRAILQVQTGGYDVFVVHKSPYNRAERLADMDRIGPVITALVADGASVIVMGDFNAYSEADADFLSSQTQLLQALPASHLKNGGFDFDVMNGYSDLGLVDATTLFGFENITFPTLLRPGNRPESEQAWRAERVDYILTDPATAARMLMAYPRTRLLNFTSDHYPVVAFIANPTHSYFQWIEGFPGLSDLHPLADPDGDGQGNLVEFVLDGDPGTTASTASPRPRQASSDQVVLEFDRRLDSRHTTLQVLQHSEDLVRWTDHPVPAGSQGAFEMTPHPVEPHLEQVRFSLDSLNQARHFFRLWVQWLWE